MDCGPYKVADTQVASLARQTILDAFKLFTAGFYRSSLPESREIDNQCQQALILRAIDQSFQSEVFALWNALADYSSARTSDALTYFFDESSRLINADGVRWCLCVRLATGESAIRDLCSGWRVREVLVHHATPEVQVRVRVFLDGVGKQDPVRVGEPTIRVLRGSGEFRLLTLRSCVADFEQFCCSEHHRLYYALVGIADRLWVGCPVSADVESGFVFDRLERSGKGLFTVEEQMRAAFLLQGIRWFHQRLVLDRKVAAGQSPCTPAERRALALLLTGKSEKEIADTLGRGPGTVHKQITAIFRKFGVRGRAELMALWL